MGTSTAGTAQAGDERWALSGEHVERLSAWLAAQAQRSGIGPEHAADLLVQALTADGRSLRDWIGDHAAT